jgi:putative aldouronate transport system permease protein
MAMVETKSITDRIIDVFIYLAVGTAALVCFYPMLYVLFASVSDPVEFMKFTGFLTGPLGLTWEGYRVLLRNPSIPTGYLNTIIYVGVGTAVNMFLTTMAAYALSRTGFRLKVVIMVGILVTMYFDGGIIPRFLLVRALGLLNTRAAIILPVAIGTWNLIVMRTAFAHVPKSLEESALMDGANHFTILYRIFIPVSKATVSVIILFYSVNHWNSWFTSMIYLRDRSYYPLQLILREILLANQTLDNGSGGEVPANTGEGLFYLEEILKYGAIVVSTVPILFIYPFVQKYFTSGVMLGSVKG